MGVATEQLGRLNSVSTPVNSRENILPLPRAVAQLGFWSALLTSILSAAWAAFFGVQNLLSPIPELDGATVYVEEFKRIHMLNLYPSILLPVPFIVLIACIY